MTWLCLAPLRRVPADRQVARFIEERRRRSTIAWSPPSTSAQAGARRRSRELMMPPPRRGSSAVDVDAIVVARRRAAPALRWRPRPRRAGHRAASFARAAPARQAVDAASLTLFPDASRLEVTPGQRAHQGRARRSRIDSAARRATAPRSTAQIARADGDRWRAAEMTTRARRRVPSLAARRWRPFSYRVVAGALTSPIYEIAVARCRRASRASTSTTPIRRARGWRRAPRTDGGDIYAPAGTDVRVQVFTPTCRCGAAAR